MSRSVILGAARTPFGRLGGGLSKTPAVELGARAIRAALDRSGVSDADVGYVVMGQVLQAGVGQIPSRQAQIAAGLPREIGSETINKVCASGLRAVAVADQMIRAGDVDVVVAGGMESMSLAPFLLQKARFGYRLGNGELVDAAVHDGLVSTFDGCHMVEQTARVARELGIGRDEQDAWALRSQERAVAAIDAGRLAEEIVPLEGVEHDEAPRRDTSLEKLSRLPPVMDPEGTVTVGNAPGLNDGAGALVVASESYARSRGLEPLARIVASGWAANDVANLPRAPALATQNVLGRAGKAVGDLARIEINEAFCAVAVHATRMLGADPERVNVNGGAVALGHPIGASGARLVTTLAYELRRIGGGLGAAAICSGGGQGDAILIEA
ncbi:MAG: acetyl-CoA C-acetyltransferase [Thermoleophilia bacterium]|nr:acetyl-CoA C-acetyltransferase [Thermoleophilia bacterium]